MNVFKHVKLVFGAILVVWCAAICRSAAADESIFSFSEAFWVKYVPSTQRLDLMLSNGAQLSFNTQQSEFTPGTKNQGSWSSNQLDPHFHDNPNYFAGWSALGTGVNLNNFFTFDLAALPAGATVQQADLTLSTFIVSSNSGRTFQPYSLWDVSTDPETLSLDQGFNLAIFDDLGSGVNYGDFQVPVNNASPNERVQTTMSFQLNASALSDIRNHAGGFFSIGGSGPTPIPAVPEPNALTLIGVFAALGSGFWLKQARRMAAKQNQRKNENT